MTKRVQGTQHKWLLNGQREQLEKLSVRIRYFAIPPAMKISFRTRDKNKFNIRSHTLTFTRIHTRAEEKHVLLGIWHIKCWWSIQTVSLRYSRRMICVRALYTQIVRLQMAIVFSWFTIIRLLSSVCYFKCTYMYIEMSSEPANEWMKQGQFQAEVMEHLIHASINLCPIILFK